MTTSLACSSPSRWPSNLSKSALPNSTLGLRCEKRGEMSHSAEWAGAATAEKKQNSPWGSCCPPPTASCRSRPQQCRAPLAHFIVAALLTRNGLTHFCSGPGRSTGACTPLPSIDCHLFSVVGAHALCGVGRPEMLFSARRHHLAPAAQTTGFARLQRRWHNRLCRQAHSARALETSTF